MNILLRPVMYLALLGAFASFVVHITSYMGAAKPLGFDPWLLQKGLFVVWLPTSLVVYLQSREHHETGVWKTMMRSCPPWMLTVLFVLFGYALLNLFRFTFGAATVVGRASALRVFSGHWMLFYYLTFAILYSAIHISDHDTAIE
jgi:hypothetical protein